MSTMMDTSKAYAVRPMPRHQTANPWPLYEEAERNFERFVEQKKAALAWGWQKSRTFPITRYYTENAAPGKNYCKLPSLDIDQIEAAYRSYWKTTRRPRRARKKGRLERFIDGLIALRQGWRKIDRALVSSGKSHPLFR